MAETPVNKLNSSSKSTVTSSAPEMVKLDKAVVELESPPQAANTKTANVNNVVDNNFCFIYFSFNMNPKLEKHPILIYVFMMLWGSLL
jgi:hypothetical protein